MSEEEQASIAAEMAALGRIFGEAISTAWQSEERYALQADIKEGLDRFIAEVDAAVLGRYRDHGRPVGVEQCRPPLCDVVERLLPADPGQRLSGRTRHNQNEKDADQGPSHLGFLSSRRSQVTCDGAWELPLVTYPSVRTTDWGLR